MAIEIAVGAFILLVLLLLATFDMAYSRLSDVGLRKLVAETDEAERSRSTDFLREILENRPRFRLALSSTIQILLVAFTLVVVIVVIRYTLDRTSLVVMTLSIALAATVVFRQILPRLVVRNNAEQKLLFLLPVVRPLYLLTATFAQPIGQTNKFKDLQKLEGT
ncbi:MAG: CNNM domain-containing protein, partial [Pyrinomonadaceae bacterium]